MLLTKRWSASHDWSSSSKLCSPSVTLTIANHRLRIQVKTNLGHSEAASGLSAVIKVVLSFEHGKIPATYGVTKLNPKRELTSSSPTAQVYSDKFIQTDTNYPRSQAGLSEHKSGQRVGKLATRSPPRKHQ